MIVVADTGALISLAIIDKLSLLESIYGEVYIPEAVWDELMKCADEFNIPRILPFREKTIKITIQNKYQYVIDKGESEAITMYQEINADYLLIDDKSARKIAELDSVVCIGTLGILTKAKEKKLIDMLRPHFIILLEKNRYYSKPLLNRILTANGEEELGDDDV
jgi:predicted nucleic acid-binding protein